MSKTSCIQHPPSMTIVMIRQDYVLVCCDAPDPQCAAAILNNMEYWTNVKLANHRQVQIENEIAASEEAQLIPDDGTWIYKTHEETQAELLDLFGRNKIVNNSTWLVERGYIEIRNNPRFKWADRTFDFARFERLVLNDGRFKMAL